MAFEELVHVKVSVYTEGFKADAEYALKVETTEYTVGNTTEQNHVCYTKGKEKTASNRKLVGISHVEKPHYQVSTSGYHSTSAQVYCPPDKVETWKETMKAELRKRVQVEIDTYKNILNTL